ncbi:hypothetical protein GGF32_003723 [Allomyces javanicus]|nr:hypothetical protein GGF32_003723 [Allomyces javanicus]
MQNQNQTIQISGGDNVAAAQLQHQAGQTIHVSDGGNMLIAQEGQSIHVSSGGNVLVAQSQSQDQSVHAPGSSNMTAVPSQHQDQSIHVSDSYKTYKPMDDSIRVMVFRVAAYVARPAPEYPYRMDRGSALAQVAAPATPPSMLLLPPMPRLPAEDEFVGPVAPLALQPKLDLVDAAIDMGGLLDTEEWFTWALVAAPAGLPAKVHVQPQARARVLPLLMHYPLPAAATVANAPVI